jgi:hypothetical protein
MSTGGFLIMPVTFVILFVTLLSGVGLLVVGAMRLIRGRDSLINAIKAGAIFVGGLVLLALVVSMFLGEPINAFVIFVLLFAGIFGLLVWVATLADCAINEPSQGNEKIVWIIIIVFTHILGAVLYLLLRRPRRIAQTGR